MPVPAPPPVPETTPANVSYGGPSERLSELCAPCFALVLQLRASGALGDARQLGRRVDDLLRDIEQEALAAGWSAADAGQAKMALVAFVDETILSSDWDYQEAWMDQPLQARLYDRYDLGEEFFVRLAEMRRAPSKHAEVLEVYYLCMALGFEGRYRLHEQEKLREIVESTCDELCQTPGFHPGPLAPNGEPDGQPATELKSKLPAWGLVAIAVALGLLVYLGMSLHVSDAAADAAAAIRSVAQAEHGP